MEFANTFDLVIANTWFTTIGNKLITLQSGTRACQIDYIVTNRRHLTNHINCDIVLTEAVVSQNRLVVMDLGTKRKENTLSARE